MTRKPAILIPARLNSTRLPQKALIQVRGKSILQRTYERAASLGHPTYVVTEDNEIVDEVIRFGGHYIINTTPVSNGTEAIKSILDCIELNAATTKIRTIINVQGDCPVFDLELLKTIIKKCNSYSRSVITGFYTTQDSTIIQSPSHVKIATALSSRKQNQSLALYFSRSPIPFDAHTYKIHVGIYGINRWDLSRFETISNSEKLEQLAWLSQGVDIRCFEGNPSISVDTPEDIETLERYLYEHEEY